LPGRAIEDDQRFFGKDPFAQGLAANRHDVDSMVRFAHEQGMLSRPLTADELFAPSTRQS
jgi:hypothetical protein